eukprot:m.54493 g.54493  ORF g.54493 m.54493 type:complete len:60 (-) comp10931_c1_seq2:107-286(-)
MSSELLHTVTSHPILMQKAEFSSGLHNNKPTHNIFIKQPWHYSTPLPCIIFPFRCIQAD